jgi:hypothetical protein
MDIRCWIFLKDAVYEMLCSNLLVGGGGLLVDERCSRHVPPNRKKSQKIEKNRKSFLTCSKIFRRVVCDCYMSKNFATCRKILLHVEQNRNFNFILSQKACDT